MRCDNRATTAWLRSVRTAIALSSITREASAVRLSSNGVYGKWQDARQRPGLDAFQPIDGDKTRMDLQERDRITRWLDALDSGDIRQYR